MRKVSLLVLFLTVFIDLIGFGMVIPFVSFYAREYGARGITVGAIVGMYSIMQFFFAPVWGRLSDRIGRRPVILISLTASCVGYLLFGMARGIGLLFASRIIAGAGGANIGTAQAYIADTTTLENRARGMGMIGAAFGIGFILGPPLSGLLATLGIRHGLPANLLPGASAATLSFIALIMAIFVLGESKAPDTAIRSRVPPYLDPTVWRSMMRHSVIFAIVLALFLTLLAVAGMETSVPLHGRDRFHFSPLDLAYFFLFMGVIVATIQGGLIGRLAKWLGEKTLVSVGTLSFTAGFLLLPMIFRMWGLYVVAFFLAIGQGLTYPSLTSLLTKASSPSEHGTILGLASGIGSLARFLGPIVSGFFYDHGAARGAFFAGAAFTLAAFVVSMWMRRLPLAVES